MLKEDAKGLGLDKIKGNVKKKIAEKVYEPEELAEKDKGQLLKIMAAKDLMLNELLPATSMINAILESQEEVPE